jgi:hypothetical protein
MNRNTVEQDVHLPRWAYSALALVAAVIGIACSVITAQFFILGLERTETDGLAREALIAAGVLMIVVELAAFGLSALLPRERLKALRTRLIWTGIALVAFEIATLYAVQVTLVRGSEAVHHGASSRIAHLEASIAQNRQAAAALVATGLRSGQSVIASSRADGAQALSEAARIEQRNAALAAELSQLQAGQRPTLAAVLGEDGMIWYSVARGVLIVGMGLVMFAAAGALLRAGRGVSVAADAPASATASNAVTASTAPAVTPPYSAARRWAAAGVPAAALPAAAFASPVITVTAPAYPAASYSGPVGAPVVTAPVVATSLHAGASTSMQSGADAVDAPAVKKPRRAAAPRAASVRDSGTSYDDGARFMRVKQGIESGRIKPSIRAIYAAEGASQEVARRYLAELERIGLIERQSRGYALRGAPAEPRQMELVSAA